MDAEGCGSDARRIPSGRTRHVCVCFGVCALILIKFENVGPAAGVSPWDTSRGDSRNARVAIILAELFPSQGRG
jgi:hypothetical protein